MDESVNSKKRIKSIIENLRSINEAEETPDEKDELSDKDVKDDAGTEATDADASSVDAGEDDGMEKIEITEFIITVDDVDSAIQELADLGVTAERVPVEKTEKPEETPADDTNNLDINTDDTEKSAKIKSHL